MMMFAAAGGPGMTNDFLGKRVLIIGIDGCRPDALQKADIPNIRKLMEAGSTTWTAHTGGDAEGPTQQPTLSGPGWTSLLTGKYTNVHGVTGNKTTTPDTPGGYQVTAAPNFASLLKQRFPKAVTGSIVSWGWIEDYLIKAQPGSFDLHEKGTGGTYPERDGDVTRKAVAYLKSADPDVLFVHLDHVDGTGHGSGFSVNNPAYLQAIHDADAQVGELMEAIRSRPQAAREDWLVILTSDHGGTEGGAHGGQSVEERTIPLIVSGKDVPAARIETSTPGLHVIPAIVFRHLAVKVDPSWGWEPGIFGYPPVEAP